ncbi:MAG: hypothetical protein AB8G26_00820 [Ilumatobacter sp.]
MGGRPRLLTRPPRIGRLLPRHRLIDAAGASPVVALVAPTGSGCTTAAAQIAAADEHAHGVAIAWCRLAHAYDTARDVVDMIADSLGAESSTSVRVIDLADRLLDMFEAGPLTVVIDDYHLASDGDIDRVIAECVELMPPTSRFVIATSARPAGLIGLVSAPNACILDATDLAFDADESRSLFEHHGANAADADRWHRQLGGWVQGVASGAHAPTGDPAEHVDTLLAKLNDAGPPATDIVDAVAALPYATAELLTQMNLGVDAGTLVDLVASTPLLTDHDGYIRMADTAAAAHSSHMDPERLARLRIAAGRLLADDDPTTSIDLLIDAGAPDLAADVLADHLSAIGVERALNWLYRLPSELRRRFPPVLAAGQATVDIDAALAAAQARVEIADSPRSRREALFALGSVEAHRGELAAAAGAFESALRSVRDDTVGSAPIAAALASTRWLLDDLLGARSALGGVVPDPATRWLQTQIDVADGVPTPAIDLTDEDDPYTYAAAALTALVRGDTAAGLEHAAESYRRAVDGGGEPFVAAAAVRAWSLLRSDQHDAALQTADELERRLGPRHQLARVHGAIIRERGSRGSGDAGQHERDQRRLRDLRTRGYASIERLSSLVLDTEESPGHGVALEVCVIGEHRAICDGRTVRRSDWKSKKALEVLTVLASYGSAGGRREQIMEAVWPGRDPEKGRTLLRTALSEIRRVLEPDRPPGEPSRFLTAADDIIVLDGVLDLDRLDDLVSVDPAVAFGELRVGLAPTVVGAEWAQEWSPRVERLVVSAASTLPDNAERLQRIDALEALIAAEPWQRRHYDRLVELHRAGGDSSAADDVERRWFDDD